MWEHKSWQYQKAIMEMRISLHRSRDRMETPIDVTANEVIGTFEANHVVEIVRVRISKYVKMGATKWQISCSTLVKPSKALVNELELKYLCSFNAMLF